MYKFSIFNYNVFFFFMAISSFYMVGGVISQSDM
jgi:hypothetical protein